MYIEDEKGTPFITIPETCELNLSKIQMDKAVTNILASDIGPDLNRLLSDIKLKLELFKLTIRRSTESYQFLELHK